MKRRLSVAGAIAIAALVLGSAPQAYALNATFAACRAGMTKAALKYFGKVLKINEKCNDKNLKATGSCPPNTVTDALPALQQKLSDGIDKKCPQAALTVAQLHFALGYPGKCTDPNPADGFTYADFKTCMQTAHSNGASDLLGIEYNTTSQLPKGPLNCQKAVSKNGIKLATAELKAVQNCRNALEAGKLTGILGKDCATSDPSGNTQAAIAKAESKARAGITKKCLDGDVATIGLCANSNCTPYCGTCNVPCAGDCIVNTHHKEIDGTEIDFSDLIDFEYATPNVCGDNAVDPTTEECDGTDDAACPGDCGAPNSQFPCLCTTVPRERIVEHKEADLDNGWTGTSHDSGIVEGGGYFLDLFDCDGPGGPDTLCNSGPTCSGAPHSSCAVVKEAAGGTTGNSICAGLSQGTCRRSVVDVGPHCNLTPDTKCNSDADCSSPPGNRCVNTFHGAPLPLFSGSISVCVVNTFTEDVVGTKDVANCTGSVHLRQNSATWGPLAAPPPCPVCGGFCQAGPTGNRHLCTIDADCADVGPAHHCITDSVCSGGTNQDQACRHDPPYGGTTDHFGNPSVDCPPNAVSNGGLLGTIDIIFNPATTQTTTMVPSFQCDATGFGGKTCAGGTNNGATCTTDSECPGVGSAGCRYQCFCPTSGGIKEKPNGCDPACVGGGNDAGPCIVDSECPGGFCHLADCREDLSAPVGLQPNEGACTQTFEGHCSVTSYKGCTVDGDCSPTGGCSFCQGGETCSQTNKNCFINSGIVRTGAGDPPVSGVANPQSAAVFCITATGTTSVDGTAGLPGPGALHQPTTTIDTGF